MVEFTKTIKDPLGLHARPVALLYDIIAKHRSDVSVSIGNRHVDGRDVIGLMALCGECGEDIVFRVSGVGSIAGCYVTDGSIVRGSNVRLLRDNVVIFEGKLASLKRFKDDVREVNEGYECGMSIEKFNDIKEGDVIEAYIMEELQQ